MPKPATSSTPSPANLLDDDKAEAGFSLALRASGRAEKTVTTYLASIAALRRFSVQRGMPPLTALTTEHLREFFNHLYQRGNKPGGVAVRYGGLRQFYRWLLEEGERQDNPMDRIPPPRVPETLQPHYSVDDMNSLLARIRPTSRSPFELRNRAILLTLYDTGLRANELCGLREEDLDLRGGLSLTVRRSKGGRERVVGIGAVTAQAIERYLRRRAKPSPWLFAAREGGPMGFDAVRHVLRRLCREASVTFRGLHAFRRGFAIAFLDAGGDPEDLRTLAGWESSQMLRRYTKATERQRALKAHRRFSPVDQLGGRS